MKHRGFTLIEVIVVIGVIILVLPVLFGIIFSLLREQVKLTQLSEVKRQGDYAFSIMQNTIRTYAYSIHTIGSGGTEQCANAGETNVPVNYFRDNFGNWFRFTLSGVKLASESGITNADADLTTNKVTISNLVVTCSRTALYSTPIVDMQFTVRVGASSQLTEERAQMVYRTRVKLRNF